MALMAHLLALDGDNHLDRQAQRQLEVSAKVWGETYPRGRYPAAFGKTELSGSAP